MLGSRAIELRKRSMRHAVAGELVAAGYEILDRLRILPRDFAGGEEGRAQVATVEHFQQPRESLLYPAEAGEKGWTVGLEIDGEGGGEAHGSDFLRWIRCIWPCSRPVNDAWMIQLVRQPG